jgi:ABC-type multidrug transport system fused ATPase/permease subunit
LKFLDKNESLFYIYLYLFFKLGIHGAIVVVEIYMSNFANSGEEAFQKCINETNGCSTLIFKNLSIMHEYKYYASIFAMVLVIGTLTKILFYRLFCHFSRNIHNTALIGLTRTSCIFFDTNPSGRILNRFTKDLGQVKGSK